MRIRVLGQYIHRSLALLAVVEFLLLGGCLFAGALIRFKIDLSMTERLVGPLWPRMLLFGMGMAVSMLAFGLYSSRQRAPVIGILVRLATAIAAGTAITAMSLYIVPNLWLDRSVMLAAASCALVVMVASRTIFARFADEEIFKRRVLIYGTGRRAGSVARLRRRSDRRGFVVVGYVRPNGEASEVPSNQLVLPNGTLLATCQRLAVDEIVVAMDDRRVGFPILDLLECRMDGLDVTDLITFLERETGRVRLDVLDPSWIIFGGGFRRDWLRALSSRALDLIASVAILAAAAPVILLAALAIKLEDGWRAPILYRQSRVGLNNEPFDVLKFRSMRIDAEKDGKAQWAQKADPRITRVGAIIRRLRVDELPQIVNVLRGDMSFVGPRPERPQFVSELAHNIPYYLQRHCVKPGITGWAQLCYPYGSSEKDALEKLQYDLYYIKNSSLLFDLAIIVQTAEVVFMGKGAR